jgi:hypothetical protein
MAVWSFWVIPCQINTGHNLAPQNWMIFVIVVLMEISTRAKIYCSMAVRFLGADIQSCQKLVSWAQFVLENWHNICHNWDTELILCWFQWPVTSVCSVQLCFQGLQIWIWPCVSQNVVFSFFFFKVHSVHVLLFKTSANVKLGLQWDWALWSILLWSVSSHVLMR